MANCVQCGRRLPPFSFGKKICKWCVQYEAAQRGEVSDDAVQPVIPAPWQQRRFSPVAITQALIGINALVFVAMLMAGGSITGGTSDQLIRWGANAGFLTVGGQWWRLLTCMFLHIGVLHILFNMWCLWDLGALCEALYGRWTFLTVYVISGLSGSLMSVAWQPGRVSAGASGAIFGLAGALIASFWLGEFSAPREAVRGALRSVVMFAVYNLLFGAISGRTDNAAHIGGLLAGFVMGVLIARIAPDGDRPLRRAIVLLPVLLAIVAGAGYLQHARAYLIHTRQARILLEQNKPDEAMREFKTAVRQRPDYAPAHFGLAYIYTEKDRPEEAESEWQCVTQLDPRNAGAHYELGLLYLDLGRLEPARKAFRQMLAIDSNSAYAHIGLGMAFATEHDFLKAIDEYKIAARLDPNAEGLYYNIGLAYSRLNLPDPAIAAFRQAVSQSDDYKTELALASAYQAKGMQPQAEAALRRAAQLKKTK
jgi:rhomboid protease GluP